MPCVFVCGCPLPPAPCPLLLHLTHTPQTKSLVLNTTGSSDTSDASSEAVPTKPRGVVSYWKPLLTLYMLEDQPSVTLPTLDPVLATSLLVSPVVLRFPAPRGLLLHVAVGGFVVPAPPPPRLCPVPVGALHLWAPCALWLAP
jgi:hypothetical protein